MRSINKSCIIIVNYNGYEDTVECIESIKNSSTRVDIIIVDNASVSDGRRLKEKYKNDKEITIIDNKVNSGSAGGNNIGIRFALRMNYDSLILLNNDTVIDCNMIENLLKNIDFNNVTVPLMYYYNSEEIWFGGGKMHRVIGNGKGLIKGVVSHESIFKQPIKCTYATTCCMAIRKEVFLRIGLFDESYFMYCDDTEFCVRLLENGINIHLIPTAKLWHKVSHSSGGENSPLSVYYINRNRLHMIKKHQWYFSVFAYPISLITRYLRYLQYKRNNPLLAKHIKKAIADHMNNVFGKVELK